MYNSFFGVTTMEQKDSLNNSVIQYNKTLHISKGKTILDCDIIIENLNF